MIKTERIYRNLLLIMSVMPFSVGAAQIFVTENLYKILARNIHMNIHLVCTKNLIETTGLEFPISIMCFH